MASAARRVTEAGLKHVLLRASRRTSGQAAGRVAPLHVDQDAAGQVNGNQEGAGERGAPELRLAQVGAAEDGLAQVGSGGVSAPQVGRAQIGAGALRRFRGARGKGKQKHRHRSGRDQVSAGLDHGSVGHGDRSLKVRPVDRFVARMQEFTDLMPRYRGSTVYGAVAYLKADGASDSYVERQGLYVMRATGSSASITNPRDFRPPPT